MAKRLNLESPANFMKRVVKIIALGLILLFMLGNGGVNYLSFESNVYSSPHTNSVLFVNDSFESMNASDTSQITSLDSKEQNLIGCGVFSGTLQGTNLSTSYASSSGGSDILLFGWNQSIGYWSTNIGGTGNDFCQKVIWIDEHLIGVVGSFENTITIGTNDHASKGGTDGFFSIYNITNQQWVNTFTLGSSLDDKFNSFVPLTNGSYVILGTTKGNISQYSNLIGAPECDPTPPATTTQCTILLYLGNALQPHHIKTIESTGSVVGSAIIEVGSSGKTIVAGYYNRELLTYPPNVHANDLPLESLKNGNDIFIGRFGHHGEFENLNVFGGNGSDLVYDIHPYGNGYILGGITQSTQDSIPKVTYPSNGAWMAPNGSGKRDMLILQTTTSGAITNGFLMGTSGHDLLYSVDVDVTGLVHVAGYIGSSLQLYSNQTIGQQNTRSVFHGIVNLNSGNNSHLTQAHASSGSTTGDGIAFAATATSSEDVWLAGRMVAGAQSNTFFGKSASGFADSGFLIRIGTDVDNDSVPKRIDNCPIVPNVDQLNYDSDDHGDACDQDDDNDGIPDEADIDCPNSIPMGFKSMNVTDHDGDGCSDASEDLDDDNDGFSDIMELYLGCQKGYVNWTAGNSTLDRDADGCHDFYEDEDDDGDGYDDDGDDRCSELTSVVFDSSNWSDYDFDGCEDSSEDIDDDNDGLLDELDACDPDSGEQFPLTNWLANASNDWDSDGCKDSGPENSGYGEDLDDDNDGYEDAVDSCSNSDMFLEKIDLDEDGCLDSEDADIDGDGLLNTLDSCPNGVQMLLQDEDDDGCDRFEDEDDDNDGVLDEFDMCDPNNPGPYVKEWKPVLLPDGLFTAEQDLDEDGCADDSAEDLDDDNDTILDIDDMCDSDSKSPPYILDWVSNTQTDVDRDGCRDADEDLDDDDDGIGDLADQCDPDSSETFKIGWVSDIRNDVNSDGCRDADEDLAMMAERSQNEERVFLYTTMALAGAILSVVVMLIVSGRVKGTTIIGGDNSVIKANIANGASNIVETGSSIHSPSHTEEE